MLQTWLCSTFFLSQYRPGKCFSRYSTTKNGRSTLQKQQLQKSKNWYFSKGVNPWFWSKHGHFSNFFLGNIGQENEYYDILERKIAFLGYKSKKFKSRKFDIFPKGLTDEFGPKMALKKVGKMSLFRLFELLLLIA